MFGFRKKKLQPLGSAHSARRWLASLPVNNPLGIQHAVTAELRKLEERTARRTPARLEAVFAVDAHMNGVVETLAAQYAAHATGSSSGIANQLWQALSDLTQGFQACYAAFAREIPDRGPRKKWSMLLPELIARQVIHLHRDAKFRLYRGEPWIPAKWAELHAAYSRACVHLLDRHPVLLDPSRGTTTIEHEYLVALALPLADPGNLTPAQVDWVASQLGTWCRPLHLLAEPTSSTTFHVDLGGSTGLRRGSPGTTEGRVLFVDTRPLHDLLLKERAALERTPDSDPAAESAAAQREQRLLYVRLASRVDPEFRPLARRGERTPASGPVDAIIGFKSICGFLHDEKLPPTAEISYGRSFGNTQDLAVFGRTRNEPVLQHDVARQRIAAYAAPGGSWEMKDISASGFRLHAPMSIATEVTLSMLVAIHRPEQSAWVLGIVRRMRRLSATSAEIGLQLIANALISVDLVLQPTVDDAGRFVPDEGSARAGRKARGLFLSFHRHTGEPAVQSVIVAPVEYRSAQRCSLQTASGARMVRFGRVLERHTDWVWTVIEPVEPGIAATAAIPVR